MRLLVQSAMRASAATERKERKTAAPTVATTTKSKFQQALSSSDIRKISKASVKDGAPASTTARRDNDDNDGDDDIGHRPKEFAFNSLGETRKLLPSS